MCITFRLTGADQQKRFNTNAKPLYSSHPTKTLSTLLSDLLSSSLPINILPGPGDPSGVTLPQQPLPKVMFGGKKMEGLECNTNPAWMEVGGRT
jgi:DNA polymerase delta subunit 2